MTNWKPDPAGDARSSPMAAPIHQQQLWEDATEYSRFLAYLSAGPERTYKAAAVALGISESTVSRNGAECRWTARAAAWDAENDIVVARMMAARQIHARVEQANLGRKMRRMAEAGLDHLEAEGKVITDAKDLTALGTAGSKIESTALGMAERRELSISVQPAAEMSPAERRAELAALKAELDAALGELPAGTADAPDA